MPAPTTSPALVPPHPTVGHFLRVEYLNFQNVADHREFRFRVSGPEGPTEFGVRIAMTAFGAGRLGLQDGPDVCYQKLLRAVAAGETVGTGVITIDDADLVNYREAHTRAPKHRSWTPSASPTPAFVPPRPPRLPSPQLPVAPAVARRAPAFDEGQRVSHAQFGVGVTSASSDGHTVVHFDQDGPKTFVTAMLQLEVLSAPHTWETGPRGQNRLCKTPAPGK